MDSVHAVLIVLVLVLIVFQAKGFIRGACGGMKARRQKRLAIAPAVAAAAASPTANPASSATTQALKQAASNGDNEAAAAASNAENSEYFQVCKDSDDVTKVLDCTCDDSSGFTFAKNEYGAPGLDYNTYVLSQGVDQQVVKNHSQFVEDRRNVNARGGDFTGKTWTPQAEIEGVGNSSNWIGIRGPPMKVKVCNPTQVVQDEEDEYRSKRYCF